MQDFTSLTKADCQTPMSQEEGRRIQLDMLDALAAFCAQQGLRYFLSGGTLLGAVRHQGFIPWDDDIDVNMPRPDCEKLLRLTGGKLGIYRLTGLDDGEFFNNCNWLRLYHDGTVVENFKGGLTEEHPYYHPIFIDIFPLEGLPKGKLHCRLHWTKALFFDKMRRAASLEHVEEASSRKAHLFHVIARIPARLVGYSRWGSMLQRSATRYSFDTQDEVGVVTFTQHITREKVNRDEYLQRTKVLFEGKEYDAPGNYDTYLKQLYGDYMKMPPVERQRSHHAFQLYWRAMR